MIARSLSAELLLLVNEYPIVTILGPRQAGKTTLARTTLPAYAYINLESPEIRSFARLDPKAFLSQIKGPVILDEIQRVPELLSYIQMFVDEKKSNGFFVLTGSHQLQLREFITQSLAGRTAVLQLLPLSMEELQNAKMGLPKFEDYVIKGFLPRVYDQNQRPQVAYSNYYQTYVERDVRLLINLKDASLFEKFMKLLAGRVGQLLDYNSLSADVGVDAKTIKNWLSILEASFIVFKLAPYYENFGKRVIKSPKYYFTDVGLLSFLLGIQTSEQVTRDPLMGQIFENLVILEVLKTQLNKGKTPNLYFFRDSTGTEVDLVIKKGRETILVEIKASATFNPTLLKNLRKLAAIADDITNSYLVYNGETRNLETGFSAIHYDEVSRVLLSLSPPPMKSTKKVSKIKID